MSDDQEYTPLQELIVEFARLSGISQDFIEASEHPYHCTCEKCREWWLSIGPEEEIDGSYTWGPFQHKAKEMEREYIARQNSPI